jgi:undecaprenyl diphosphate synthase
VQEAAVPCHVAIIMDGNGRWAKQRHLPRTAGHHAGVAAVRKTVEHCSRKGVATLTLFAFSSENWRRPQQEVSVLMSLFLSTLEKETLKLQENNIRFKIIGDRSAFSEDLQERMSEAERVTAGNTGLTLCIAANYGGRWEIVQAARSLARRVAEGTIRCEDITEQMLRDQMTLGGLTEPDLFIRTGGEQRLSNFLLWHLAYTELYFTPTLWPDFDEQAMEMALESYAGRQRRYGYTSEQVSQLAKG